MWEEDLKVNLRIVGNSDGNVTVSIGIGGNISGKKGRLFPRSIEVIGVEIGAIEGSKSVL